MTKTLYVTRPNGTYHAQVDVTPVEIGWHWPESVHEEVSDEIWKLLVGTSEEALYIVSPE